MMKYSLKNVWFVLAVAALVLVSCKKDDDTSSTSETMSGSLSVEIPPYVQTGEELTLYAGGLAAGEEYVTYNWTGSLVGDGDDEDSEYDVIEDTQTVTLKMPSKIGLYELVVYAEADGYSTVRMTRNVMVVSPENSLTDISYGSGLFTDPRDGKVYHTTIAGSLEWFCQNLNWDGAGSPYSKMNVMGAILGRLYTWNDATGGVSGSGLASGPQGVCPEGWTIPTNEDWVDLAKALGAEGEITFFDTWNGLGEKLTVNARLNDERIWPYSPDHESQNMFGWAALSSGYGNNSYNNYYMMGERGFWWSSTEYDGTNALYRYIYYDDPDFPFNPVDKDDFAAAVRCVRLKQQD